MRVIEFLDSSGVKYEIAKHPVAFSAQTIAATMHESGKYVAKPVLVKIDGEYMLCVLPASFKIDIGALKRLLGAKSIELANEDDIGKVFPDCEIGAQPPFGNLYDVPTIMDKSLEDDDHIVFQAGSHEKAIRMTMADFRKIANPCMMDFSYHTV